jgi:hypothetical protein
MEQGEYRRKTALLCALIAIASVYSFWIQQRHMVTGNPTVDGTLSVFLGLYICSRPAGNAIDLFFYERNPFHRVMMEWSTVRWLALNILTLLMGWMVIYLGTTHLTGRAD